MLCISFSLYARVQSLHINIYLIYSSYEPDGLDRKWLTNG